MKVKILFVIANLLILGCQQPKKTVKYIEVATTAFNGREVKKVTINDMSEINSIVSLIEQKSREPRKFISHYSVKLVYDAGKEEVFLINGKSIKKQGVSFMLPNNTLSLKLQHLFE